MFYNLKLKTYPPIARFVIRRAGNCQGVTLVHLATAIAIIAVMATISIPALRSYQPNIKLKAESRQLVSDLRYAQQLTITEQNIYYVEINLVGASYTIVKQDEPNPPIKAVELEEGVNFQDVSGFDNNRIVFNSYGAVSQSGAITLVNSQGKTYTLNVKPSGYVQLRQ